ncbi:MAG: apolipoprotein N-acyltransferase, partial [Pseudomonadota bacterium]
MRAFSNRISSLTGWRRFAVAALAGAIFSFAQAPFHLFVLGFFTFPLLVWLLDGIIARESRTSNAVRQAASLGWWFGFGYFVVGLWWISNALLVEAPEYAWFIPVAVFGLPAVLAVFFAAACGLAWTVWSDGLSRVFALAATFGFFEWTRSFVLSGFPWNSIGYAMMPTPIMMQSVAVFGVFGMGALSVLLFCMPVGLAQTKRAPVVASVMFSLLLFGGHVGFGYWRLQETVPDAAVATMNLRLVQPALDQADKVSQADPSRQFDDLLALSSVGRGGVQPDMVIWPETAVPFLLTREPSALAAIGNRLEAGQTLLTGVAREEASAVAEGGRSQFFNSIMQIDDAGIIQDAADKVHLVPFGEYLPFAAFFADIGLQAVAAADRGYSAASARRVLTVNGVRFVPLICYEAIFPAQTVDGDVLLNVTNDAWFGLTPGPFQHMHQTRLRAVEAGRPLVRVANNGVSGVFDGNGRALAWVGY